MYSLLTPSDDEMKAAEKRFREMMNNGPFQAGVMQDFDLNHLPTWMDHEKLLKAQATARKYFLSMAFVHLSGLMFVLQIPTGFIPLITTSKSESVAALFLRYLSTINHVNEWSESDPLDPKSKAHKSITHVRRMHQAIFEKMKKFKKINDTQGVWVSQIDMVVTQWAFVGLLFMYPRSVGILGSDEEVREVLHDIGYLWRCIGWMHGITDENNMCSGTVEETIALCHVIYQKYYEPVINVEVHANPLGLQMGLDIVQSIKYMMRVVNGEIILTFWSHVLNVKMPYLRKLSFAETIVYYLLCFEHNYMDGTYYREWHASRVRARIASMNENKAKIYEQLKAADPTLKYAPDAIVNSPCGFALPANFWQELNSKGSNEENKDMIRNEE